MARQRRIDYPGAIHHVMNRGADRQVVFRDDVDRKLFLSLWKKAVLRFGIEVISFALVGNHYHFLVRSPDAQLSETLQFIGQSYTQQFNSFHGRDGALFRGRFHSILVDSDRYLARVARYIELNPVEAGLTSVEMLHRYRWSSFKYYAADNRDDSWLSRAHVLERFSSPAHYIQFVLSEREDTELERFYRTQIGSSSILGKEAFASQIRSCDVLDDDVVIAGVPDFSIAEVEAAVLSAAGVGQETLRFSQGGAANPARSIVVALAQSLAGATPTELAPRYGFEKENSVTSAIRRSWKSTDPSLCKLRQDALALLH